jgi:purine nucleosidase
MGGSPNPQTDDPEYLNDPRREFNLWFDPEAAHILLRAPWPSIVCTTVDVSVKTKLTQQMFDQIHIDLPLARDEVWIEPRGRRELIP